MKTKQAKNIIIHEVATNGVVTDKAMRLYCEHRISKSTFDKLVNRGKEMEKLTRQMQALEIEIARQRAYIIKHGEANDAGEYGPQWEQYKEEAAHNLKKWDLLKAQRDKQK